MVKKDEVWVIAEMLTEGEPFEDDGRRRVVASMHFSHPYVTITCTDGTQRTLLGRTPIRIWDSALTAEFGTSSRDVPPEESSRKSDSTHPRSTSRTRKSAAAPVEQEERRRSKPAVPDQNSSGRMNAPGTHDSGSGAASLATITLVVEIILWITEGLTLIGSVRFAFQSESGFCNSSLTGVDSCTTHPYVLASVVAAALGTAFFLFGIAIMRAVRLWARRLEAGLPV